MFYKLFAFYFTCKHVQNISKIFLNILTFDTVAHGLNKRDWLNVFFQLFNKTVLITFQEDRCGCMWAPKG